MKGKQQLSNPHWREYPKLDVKIPFNNRGPYNEQFRFGNLLEKVVFLLLSFSTETGTISELVVEQTFSMLDCLVF